MSGSTTASFTNIPQTYTDLLIVLNARANGFNGSEIYLKFNDSTTSYSSKFMWKDGNTTSLVSGTLGISTSIFAGIITGAQAGTNSYGSGQIYIYRYTDAVTKFCNADIASERSSTSDTWYTMSSGGWSNNAAITKIDIVCSHSFLGTSTVYLYGIKNS
jgi:hypothetical protein